MTAASWGEAPPRWDAVLFDLDGTVADSAPVVTAAMAETLQEYLGFVPSEAELRSCIGPPLPSSMARFGASGDLIKVMTDDCRARYSDHMFDSPLFPGIADLIRKLVDAGIPVSIATSKPQPHAIAILEHLGVADKFVSIRGSDMAELRSAKSDIIGDALADLTAAGHAWSPENVIMVGDRYFDTQGAAHHGIRTVLVRWGTGTDDEHAEAWASITTPEELAEILLG